MIHLLVTVKNPKIETVIPLCFHNTIKKIPTVETRYLFAFTVKRSSGEASNLSAHHSKKCNGGKVENMTEL